MSEARDARVLRLGLMIKTHRDTTKPRSWHRAGWGFSFPWPRKPLGNRFGVWKKVYRRTESCGHSKDTTGYREPRFLTKVPCTEMRILSLSSIRGKSFRLGLKLMQLWRTTSLYEMWRRSTCIGHCDQWTRFCAKLWECGNHLGSSSQFCPKMDTERDLSRCNTTRTGLVEFHTAMHKPSKFYALATMNVLAIAQLYSYTGLRNRAWHEVKDRVLHCSPYLRKMETVGTRQHSILYAETSDRIIRCHQKLGKLPAGRKLLTDPLIA